MKERRKLQDRRAYKQEQDAVYPHNRRNQPCRRLNNISVRWFPFNKSQPSTHHP